ncbi:hypothetical protein SDJN02_15975 [Cucurbita argyrosperma subsp. argyrosperma]|nr:hypothetical protein SDJN02_15975 [Cucurbita argyrosperma subsp. argyrosperma]
MAASARFVFLSRVTDFSIKPRLSPLPPPPPPPLPSFSYSHLGVQRRRFTAATVSCLISGVDGGGVSDDFVSTRKLKFDRGFSVIANMLKRIEPLDTSDISKGVTDAAKDSMKQTISSMFGLLPSDQFAVTVRVCKSSLHNLLSSSIITGYTLWNAEYRLSLMRNFDISPDSLTGLDRSKPLDVADDEETLVGIDSNMEDWDSTRPRLLADLPPEALKYIQQLQSELSNLKDELNARKQENMQMEHGRGNRNNLLEYLRSLDSNMVTELSKPSTSEVEEIIHELVGNILQRFFKDDASSTFFEDSSVADLEKLANAGNEFYDTVGTSRDYLAKLLFWCMLLGHRLRSLENRLQLSCVVGLL